MTTPLPPPKRLWRITHVSAELGIPRSTIKSAAYRGDFPVYCFGCGGRMVDIEDVRKWWKDRRGVAPRDRSLANLLGNRKRRDNSRCRVKKATETA